MCADSTFPISLQQLLVAYKSAFWFANSLSNIPTDLGHSRSYETDQSSKTTNSNKVMQAKANAIFEDARKRTDNLKSEFDASMYVADDSFF